jgi:multiple sugar transport system permease protein
MKNGTNFKARNMISQVLTYLVLILGVLIFLFPFYWMLMSSFKIESQVTEYPPRLFPQSFSLDSYRLVFDTMDFPRYFLNSVVVSLGVVSINLFMSVLMAYAFAKLDFPFKRGLFVFILFIIMIPFQLVMLPLFLLVNQLGLGNTYLGLILPQTLSSLSIFLLRQSFMSIPDDYIEAAILDGAGHFRILFQIVLPLSVPALVTVGLVNFLWSWNNFLWPMLMTSSDDMRTLQLAAQIFRAFLNERWGAVMAACVLAAIPIVILYQILQRQFIESIASTGVKG